MNSYTFDIESALATLNIKVFESANDEWIEFVLANRMVDGFKHDYDIVIGPVADDRVYAQFSLFEGGLISKETLIRELKTYKLVDQYLFHTEKDIPHLKYVEHYAIRK